jgi:hypothetical protein
MRHVMKCLDQTPPRLGAGTADSGVGAFSTPEKATWAVLRRGGDMVGTSERECVFKRCELCANLRRGAGWRGWLSP